jgi:ribose transport system substrate-binding protein
MAVETTNHAMEEVKVMWNRISKRGTAITLAVALVGVVAGCGSTSSGSATSAASASNASAAAASNASSQATAAIDKLLVRPTHIGITTPIKGGVPKGKKIVYLQCGIPDCALIANAMQAATAQVGWSFTRISTGTSPQNIVAAWQEALRQNPDGIVMTGGYPVAYYQAEVNQAVSRKIPVIAMAQQNQGAPFNLVIGSGQVQGTIAGTMAAKWVASKVSGGHVLVVNIPGVGAVQSEVAAFQKQLPTYCPGCSLDVLSVPPASVGTNAATTIANYLQGHQDIKYMYLTTIDLALGLPAAYSSVGLQPVPTIAATESDSGLSQIKQNQAGLQATIYWVDVEAAYRAVDGLARYYRGQPIAPDADATLPQWLVTQANLPSQRPLPAVSDYVQQFDSLWGVR